MSHLHHFFLTRSKASAVIIKFLCDKEKSIKLVKSKRMERDWLFDVSTEQLSLNICHPLRLEKRGGERVARGAGVQESYLYLVKNLVLKSPLPIMV